MLPATYLYTTRVNGFRLQPDRPVHNLPTPEGWKAELTWAAGYIPRWFICPQTVTHPSTNPVWSRATSLIEHNGTQRRATTPGHYHSCWYSIYLPQRDGRLSWSVRLRQWWQCKLGYIYTVFNGIDAAIGHLDDVIKRQK